MLSDFRNTTDSERRPFDSVVNYLIHMDIKHTFKGVMFKVILPQQSRLCYPAEDRVLQWSKAWIVFYTHPFAGINYSVM